MDDVHGFGPAPQVEKFEEDLAAFITTVRSMIT